MRPELVALVVSTVGALGGLALAVAPDDWLPRRTGSARTAPVDTVRLVVTPVVGVTVLLVSGWVLPAVISGAAAWAVVGMIRSRANQGSDIERIDALASWIENLRDVLLAGDQPVGAIRATVPSCPPPIRGPVRRLAAELGHGDADEAFRRFADDIDDPLGDLVAAGLLIAVQRGARTVAVLSALADQARAQADRRRLVEAERAPLQREVTVLSTVMGALVVGLLVFGRADYLAPYSTPEGQLVLAVVLTIYATLLLRVQRLSSFPGPRRFFGSRATVGTEIRDGSVTA